jgi:type III secretion protein W
MGVDSGSGINKTIAAFQTEGAETAKELQDEKAGAARSAQQSLEETVNPLALASKQSHKKLENRKQVTKMSASGEKLDSLRAQQIEEKAENFERRNPELPAKTLKDIREQIKPDDTPDEILKKVKDHFGDVSLVDEVLEFLQETTEGALHQAVTQTREKHNADNNREIRAGHNIGNVARETAKEGLDSPTALRNMYRDITGNPRETNALFEELAAKYAFKDLKKAIGFLLHSLGADLKSSGPSCDPGLLYRLLTETRSLQAILGVYNFFNSRMRLVNSLFSKNNMEVPEDLTFEAIAKLFISLVGERYPSGERVLETASRLGIEKWILAKIIVFSQLRDAIREVALKQIYRSVQHRDELLMAILEALEDLEDELEEMTEQEDEEEEEEEEK